ncbi:MAG TPA: hypothetical protein DCY47_15715 [Candidatus Accumulibacter sp.]|nr:hypothetical protein [Accumulibacter sp.]
MSQQPPNARGPVAEACNANCERRGAADRRQIAERRSGIDRRRATDLDPLLAELETRVASALRHRGGSIEGNGSGWDKLIVPMP